MAWKRDAIRPDMPACAVNDAFGGKVIEACLRPLGVPLAMLRRRDGREGKLAAMGEVLARHRRLLLAADYGTRRYCHGGLGVGWSHSPILARAAVDDRSRVAEWFAGKGSSSAGHRFPGGAIIGGEYTAPSSSELSA